LQAPAIVVIFLLCCAACAENKESPAAEKKESYVYDDRGRRDPFVPLVGITMGRIESLEDIMSIGDVSFQGIACDSTGKKTVIINGEMIREGGGGGRLIVKKVLKNEVILTIGDEEHRLSISESNNE